MEALRVKAARLLEVIESRAAELEKGSPAARAAAICLRRGVPPNSLARARLEGSALVIGSRSVALSEDEAKLLRIWAGSRRGLRTLTRYTSRVLGDLGLKVYDVHVLRRIAEGQPPGRVPFRLLKALESLGS